VVVVGTGSIGSRHLRVLSERGVPVFALPAIRASAGEFRRVASLGDAGAQGATMAIIATDTGRHLSDATAAVQAGFETLVEKPVAPTAAGVGALAEVARVARRRVFVGCTLRFSDTLRRFRELLPSVGIVHAVEIECRSFLPDWHPDRDYRSSYSARPAEGGVLRDLIHEIDYAGWLFGWPREIVGRVGNTGKLGIEAEEWAELCWHHDDADVSIRLDYLTRPERRTILAAGSTGTLEADLVRQRIVLRLVDGTVRDETCLQLRDDMIWKQSATFIGAATGRDPDGLATLDDGGRAIAICDTARRSEGRLITVEDWRAA
jgi:predicted dehydrogenase